jgi:hypothetical protein
MRSSKSRSRSKQNRNRSVGNIINRVFDSSGPEGKVRGTPQQIIDKYNQLARDAQLGNDRVAAENFQQHSEHYTRMLGEAMREMEAQRQSYNGGNNDSQSRGEYRPRDDRDERDERGEYRPRDDRDDERGEVRARDDRPAQGDRPQRDDQRPREDQRGEQRPREDRQEQRPPREERPREDRQEQRAPREERPREDRQEQRPPREERPREDRPVRPSIMVAPESLPEAFAVDSPVTPESDDDDSGLVETPESKAEKPKSTRARRPRTPRTDEPRTETPESSN